MYNSAVVKFYLTEEDYRATERDLLMPITVTKDKPIASPVILNINPHTTERDLAGNILDEPKRASLYMLNVDTVYIVFRIVLSMQVGTIFPTLF